MIKNVRICRHILNCNIILFGLHISAYMCLCLRLGAQQSHQMAQLLFNVLLQFAVIELTAMLLELRLNGSIGGNQITELLFDVRNLTILFVVL